MAPRPTCSPPPTRRPWTAPRHVQLDDAAGLRHQPDGAGRRPRTTRPASRRSPTSNKSSVKYVVCVPPRRAAASARPCSQQNHITGKPVSTEVDVKSVLAKVTEGEADAGLVYKTDAIAAGDQVKTFPIPGAASQTTTYPIVTADPVQEHVAQPGVRRPGHRPVRPAGARARPASGHRERTTGQTAARSRPAACCWSPARSRRCSSWSRWSPWCSPRPWSRLRRPAHLAPRCARPCG